MKEIILIPTFIYIFLTYYLSSLKLNFSKNIYFLNARRYYNLCMSTLSFYMLVCIFYGNYLDNKFYNIESLLCKENNSAMTINSHYIFYYSKYLEWIDTLFLVLANKPIRPIHIIHHAIVPYLTIYSFGASYSLIFMGTNTFVHTIMYLYYAYPSYLKSIRKMITYIQILQHFFCFFVTFYVKLIDDCKIANSITNKFAMYSYLLFIYLFTRLLKNN